MDVCSTGIRCLALMSREGAISDRCISCVYRGGACPKVLVDRRGTILVLGTVATETDTALVHPKLDDLFGILYGTQREELAHMNNFALLASSGNHSKEESRTRLITPQKERVKVGGRQQIRNKASRYRKARKIIEVFNKSHKKRTHRLRREMCNQSLKKIYSRKTDINNTCRLPMA